jgi:hypothetical protein
MQPGRNRHTMQRRSIGLWSLGVRGGKIFDEGLVNAGQEPPLFDDESAFLRICSASALTTCRGCARARWQSRALARKCWQGRRRSTRARCWRRCQGCRPFRGGIAGALLHTANAATLGQARCLTLQAGMPATLRDRAKLLNHKGFDTEPRPPC